MRASGFTLVELVVVLFIVAVVSAVSLPAVGRGMETLRIRSEAGGIVAFLRYSRQQAITTHRSQTVTVDSVGHTLSLTGEGAESPHVKRPIPSMLRLVADPPSQASITFSPQGFSSGGSLLLEGPGGRSYRITINPMTGRVTNTRLG